MNSPTNSGHMKCSASTVLHHLSHGLIGLAAILFISRDACSDSIAKLFGACFWWGIAQISRDLGKLGIAQMCLCETKYVGGASHHFGSC